MKDNYLILVNQEQPLPQFFQPGQLILGRDNVYLEEQTHLKLMALLNEIDGQQSIRLVNGFRSIEEQQLLYDTSVKEFGMTYTKKYVAKPLCSEHHTGLAVDLTTSSANETHLISPEFDWQKNKLVQLFLTKMSDFGFIQRYPEGKEHLTGISYEPWHFRYVGRQHSKKMQALDLCLEEYVLQLGADVQ